MKPELFCCCIMAFLESYESLQPAASNAPSSYFRGLHIFMAFFLPSPQLPFVSDVRALIRHAKQKLDCLFGEFIRGFRFQLKICSA